MDLIYRKEKYNEYLKRLHRIKGDLDDDTQITEIRSSINHILEDLRDKSDIRDNTILYAILLVPLVIILVWLNYELGVLGPPFIPLGLLVVFFISAHTVMKYTIQDNSSLKWNQELTESNRNAFLLYKIEYLRSALNIKVKRSILIQVFYMIFFPILLYYLYELVKGEPPFGSPLIGWLVAFFLGSSFWFFHFQRSRDDLKETDDLVEGYKSFISRTSQDLQQTTE